MKKLILAIVMVLGMAANGWALSFTYDLNYKIDGGPPIYPIGSLGTITISDDLSNHNAVDVSVTINTGLKLLGFDLNFSSPTFSLPNNFSITSASISSSLNNINADGFKGKFDLGIPGTGDLNIISMGGNLPTFTGVITAAGYDLDASYFNTLDSGFDTGGKNSSTHIPGMLYVAAHIGKGNSTLLGDGTIPSLWAGSTGSRPPEEVVPEPGTILLLGGGLIGLAFFGRRYKRS